MAESCSRPDDCGDAAANRTWGEEQIASKLLVRPESMHDDMAMKLSFAKTVSPFTGQIIGSSSEARVCVRSVRVERDASPR